MTGIFARPRRWAELGVDLLGMPAMLIVLAALVAPLAWILHASFIARGTYTFANYGQIVADDFYLGSFLLTIRLAAIVTAICAILGYLTAFVMTLMPRWLAAVALLVVTLPFWTSVLVRTYAWLVILQNNGLLNQFLLKTGLIASPLEMMHNQFGAAVGMIHIMLPYMIFPLYAQLSNVDGLSVRAALISGASNWYAFRRVYFPQTLPGVVAGCVLVFVLSLGFYVTPALLGGGKTMVMSIVIEQDINFHREWGAAAALGVLFLAGILVFLLAAKRILRTENIFMRAASR